MSLLKVAKDMIQLSMPIKCLEAVILAIHLTNEVPSMDRFTLTFKSQQNGLIYYLFHDYIRYSYFKIAEDISNDFLQKSVN